MKLLRYETHRDYAAFSKVMHQVWQTPHGQETVAVRLDEEASFGDAIEEGMRMLNARNPKAAPPAPKPTKTVMRAYISGPMTGMKDLNFPAFAEAARLLRSWGHTVVNPAELNPDPTTPWEECMKADIKALCDCTHIVMLDGWHLSKGAHLELQIAHRLGLGIEFIGDFAETV